MMNTAATLSRQRPVVVCVDDDPAVLRSLQRILHKDAYDLLTTQDPDVALDRIHRAPVDVFIADERMPSISGTDLLRVVELQSPETRRVMISAYPDETGSARSDRSLIQHFIPKPWNDELFRAILRRMVAGRDRKPVGERLPADRSLRFAGEDFMREIPVVAECLGRRIVEIVPPALRVFRKGRNAGRPVVALLESLPMLRGDPAALIADLELAASASGVDLILVDGSGLAARYRRLRGMLSARVSVYGPDDVPRSRKFLLVDAVTPRRVFLRLLLGGLGHRCRAVATPDEARDIVRAGDYDRVLVDLSDPQETMDWIEARALEERPVPMVPLMPAARNWDHAFLDRWRLQRPLVRPYRFREILELAT